MARHDKLDRLFYFFLVSILVTGKVCVDIQLTLNEMLNIVKLSSSSNSKMNDNKL
jgi:hypothetical protein